MHRINFLVLLVILIFSKNLISQKANTFTITAPESLKGDYKVENFSWGPAGATTITGSTIFAVDGSAPANDGCEPVTNDLTGKIAFIDRGTCAISDKSLNAEKKGAIAVVICNSSNGGSAGEVSGGTGADALKIPSYMLSFADCQKIRASVLSNEVMGTLSFKVSYPANTVWGNKPKEGDFNGGLNDWIVQKENTWTWISNGNIPGGPYSFALQSTATTASNGIAAFNHDLLHNDGQGPCGEECNGGLISPNISLAGQNIEGLVVEFTSTMLNFGSGFNVIASKNGGVSWPDTFQVHVEYGTFNRTAGERVRVGLCGYDGVSQVRIQFYFEGNFYYWGIDDVILLNEKVADTRIHKNFYAVAPSLKTPASQVSEIPFVADMANVGNKVAENTKMEVIIRNATGDVGKSIVNYGNVAPCTIIENKVFPEPFTPPSTAGVFVGEYKITSNGEPLNADNIAPFYFINTQSTYGTMLTEAEWGSNYMRYVFGSFIDDISKNNFYSAGNAYYVPKGQGFKVTNVRFGLANANINEVLNSFLYVDIYEWNDANNNNRCEPIERKRVGGQFVVIETGMNIRNLTVPVIGVDSQGDLDEKRSVLLKNNTQYLVMVHTDNQGKSQQQLLGHTPRVFNADQQSMYYEATNLAYDSLKINRSCGSFYNWHAGQSADDIQTRDFYKVNPPFGLGATIVYLEMDIASTSSTYEIAASGEANIFPNPASTELFIDLALPQVSKNVKVDLMSIDGRVVTSASFQQVQDSRLRIELSDIVSGTYNALIHTDQGVITRKVVIQK